MTTDPPSRQAHPQGRSVQRWLEPVRSAAAELTPQDWARLVQFEGALRDVINHPSTGQPDQPGRGSALLAVRRHLARVLHTGEQPEGAALTGASLGDDLRQTVRQFICGYYDLDLRDATGPGHGRMILRHGSTVCRQRWEPRLRAGELAGVAMTEAVGGTQVHAISTTLVPAIDGGWRLSGEKTWISRLAEAAVFVVFARTAEDRIAAVVVDATDHRIQRQPQRPNGLTGWTWGRLLFGGVPVRPADILTRSGFDGIALFDDHFTYYRPIVAATALGAAAAAHDAVAAHLLARERRGEIGRVRDHALITLGRAHAQINSGLLSVLHTQRLAGAAHPAASLWARSMKAHGVDLAREATDELSVLVGAVGFTAEHRLQKARRDLDALRYADGMHDSLNRSAGRALLTAIPAPATSHPDREGSAANADPAARPDDTSTSPDTRAAHG